jgi:recombination protein RecA
MAKGNNGRKNDVQRHVDDRSRQQAMDLALSQIEKQYGKGAIMRMGEEGGIVEVESIPSGSISLDAALGIGGLPRGRIVEIYGPEGAGKTMVAHHQPTRLW